MDERKILIVDDEEIVLKTLEQMFQHTGYIPFCTVDGNHALQLMQEQNIRVIFTDLRMPVMDGLELCRRAKEIAAESQVFAISAYVSAYSPEDFEKAGFADEFSKPFDTRALLKACKDAFDRLSANVDSSPSYPGEKRRAPRVALHKRMVISIVGSRKDAGLLGKTLLCAESSVSRIGLLIFSDQTIEPGTDLAIHVGIAGRRKQFVLDGIARWCGATEGEEPPERGIPVGVELLPSSRDLDDWREFVDDLPFRQRASSGAPAPADAPEPDGPADKVKK